VVVVLWPREREPAYRGKKLSEWLGPDMKPNGDTLEAVRAVGMNALPHLVRWLNYQRPSWQYKLMETGRKWSPRLWDKFYGRSDRKAVLMNNAIWAFDCLGAQGSPAIPDLVWLMKNGSTNVAGTAAYVLGGIGEEAVPVLLDVLTNRPAYPLLGTDRVGTMIRRPLSNGAVLVPVLVPYLTNRDAKLRGNAATMLGSLRAAPGTTVPGLVGLVTDRDKNVRYRAIVALGQFGADAHPAIASLLPVLKDSDGAVRGAAEDALRQIAPEVLKQEKH
jgi:HEAT repeats